MPTLSDTEIFSAAFPGKVTLIFQLRAADQGFDEACADFAHLVRLSGRTLQIDPAFEESLVELRQEIEAVLVRSASPNSNQRGTKP